MTRLSVIIPVYNTEKYLTRCLNSLEFRDDYEIIVVNDGSQGDCMELVESFNEQQGHSVRYVEHKVNRGLLQARITGLGYATGKYVAHLDSDDWISPHTYENLLVDMENVGAMMGMFNVTISKGDDRQDRNVNYLEDNIFEFASTYQMRILNNNKGEYLWHLNHNKVWKTSILKKAYAKLPRELHLVMCEDLLLTLKSLAVYGNGICISKLHAGSLYYFERECSSTKSKTNISDATKNIQDLISVKELLLEGTRNREMNSKIKSLMKNMARLNHPENTLLSSNPVGYFRCLLTISMHLDIFTIVYKVRRLATSLLGLK